MKPRRLYSIASAIRQQPNWDSDDADYLEKIARVVELTTDKHGPNGLAGIIDDKCETCRLVAQMESNGG